MNSPGLDFGVLGPLQLRIAGAPVPLGTPKQRAVLAMLVMGRNRPVSSDALVTAAWEQFPPPEPKASLHSYVSNLRKLISGSGADGRAVLAGAPPGYRLAVADAAHRMRIAAPFWVLGFALVWYLTVQSGLSTSLTAVAFAAIVPIRPRAEGVQAGAQFWHMVDLVWVLLFPVIYLLQ